MFPLPKSGRPWCRNMGSRDLATLRAGHLPNHIAESLHRRCMRVTRHGNVVTDHLHGGFEVRDMPGQVGDQPLGLAQDGRSSSARFPARTCRFSSSNAAASPQG